MCAHVSICVCLQGQQETRSWFQQEVTTVLDNRGIPISLELVKVSARVDQSGPGAVVNHIARQAYDLGADFLYRVNDDTEFQGRWPALFVESLRGLRLTPNSPADVLMGVLGPQSSSAPTADILMMHHFFHRTHMDIFGANCYPVEVTANEHLISLWI